MVEQMKPSGIDWIGDIPYSWDINKIKYCFSIVNGSTPDSNDFNCWDGEINWITPADMEDFGEISFGERNITTFGYDSCGTSLLPIGSIVISSRAPIGKINLTTKVLCTNQGCKSLVNNDNNKYFYYLLYALRDQLVLLGRGTTFLELSTSALANFKIIIPKIVEQKAIADFLDKQCGKIDGIISDLEKQIETLQKYKKSLILETVTKGLNKNAPMKSSGIDWIGEIPAHWDIKRIKDVSKMQTGTTPPNNEGVNIDGDGVNWFTPGDFIDGSIELLNSEKHVNNETIQREAIKIYPKHSILFVGIASIGKLGYFENACYSNQQITAIKPNNVESSKYISFALLASMDYTKSNALYTTVPIINNAYLGIIKIPFPEAKEQKEIISYLDKKCSQIDAIVKDKQEQLEKIRQHKKSLIYEYVTGKKRVKEAINGN